MNMKTFAKKNLVILGQSNIISDIFDCAFALNIRVSRIVIHRPEEVDQRSIPTHQRLLSYSEYSNAPDIDNMNTFRPRVDDVFIFGPTSPIRELIAKDFSQYSLNFCTLIHPTAYVSPFAKIGNGVFVGAKSVIGPGAIIEDHVFINRGVSIGHDTHIGSFSRLQPGANVAGLCKIGKGVSISIGAAVIERIHIGDRAIIGAGAVVLRDVSPNVLAVGVPAIIKDKNL